MRTNDDVKWCNHCHKWLSNNEFYWNATYQAYQSPCKKCKRALDRQRERGQAVSAPRDSRAIQAKTRAVIMERFPAQQYVSDCETCQYLAHCQRLQMTDPDAEVPCEVTFAEAEIPEVVRWEDDMILLSLYDASEHHRIVREREAYNRMWKGH